MNILITGALGFIGSHISQFYLQKGDHVMGLDNRSGQYPSRVYNNTLSLLTKHTMFSFYPLDIRARSKLSSLVHALRPDVIIHAAAITGIRDSTKIPYECMETNVLGTQSVLDACREYKNVRVVLLSSSSVYGDQPAGPFNENAPLKPKSIYAISKQTMESVAKYYAHQYNLPILIIRPFSVYGPGGRMNMLPYLLLKSAITKTPFIQFGTNEQNRRDWTYIDDFVCALERLIAVHKMGYDIYNIGLGCPIGIDDFLAIFQSHLPLITDSPLTVVHNVKPSCEMEITYADTSKLIHRIGASPKTPIEEGIRNLLEYYRANRKIYFPR